MRGYIARRAAAFVVTLLVVSLLVFVVVRVLPGDPALIIIGPDGSPEAAARLREAMGLNRPIAVQYAEWLTGERKDPIFDRFTDLQPGQILPGPNVWDRSKIGRASCRERV